MHKWFTIPSWHFCAITQLVKALWLAGLNQDQRHILDICFQFLIISIVLDNFWKASIYSDYCNSRFFGWTGYAGVCPSAWKSKTLSFYAHRTALLVLNIQVGSIFSFFAFLRGIGFACMLGWVNVVFTLRWLRDFRACSRQNWSLFFWDGFEIIRSHQIVLCDKVIVCVFGSYDMIECVYLRFLVCVKKSWLWHQSTL